MLRVLVIEKTIDARERRFFEIWGLAHGSPELDCKDKFGRVNPMCIRESEMERGGECL